ncbi:MAG: sigma-70 family RNA polymerase sigma factor [Planctomycetes bacterium]|nr:sigma-70 family RNA polymerase sigma factor [Planctomycetota bacterium]
MQFSTVTTARLLQRAQQGDLEAVGKVLEMHRPYLRFLADRSLQGGLRKRIGASDIVQQTYVAAMQAFDRVKLTDASSFLAWLRQIHQRQILDALRQHGQTEKRAIGREQALTDGEFPAEAEIDPFSSSPSQRLMAAEDAVLLAGALDRLPDAQAEAIRLKYLEGLTLIEVAEAMSTTKYAVVGLLNRGLKGLRAMLKQEQEVHEE